MSENKEKEKVVAVQNMRIIGLAPPNKYAWCFDKETGALIYINTEENERKE